MKFISIYNTKSFTLKQFHFQLQIHKSLFKDSCRSDNGILYLFCFCRSIKKLMVKKLFEKKITFFLLNFHVFSTFKVASLCEYFMYNLHSCHRDVFNMINKFVIGVNKNIDSLATIDDFQFIDCII